MFSSSILEGFSESDLQFVMGHDLGNYIYEHDDITSRLCVEGWL